MKVVESIVYDKESGEYIIRERDTVSGKFSTMSCNNLTEMERIFTKSAEVQEIGQKIIWL